MLYSLVLLINHNSDISDNGFALALRGSLLNIGPLDAEIVFVEPVTFVPLI